MQSVRFSLVAMFLLPPVTAWAGSPDFALRQLNHRIYTATDGAPTDIAALAQTPDGTLWIGSRTGLARFDGARFVKYPGPSEEPLLSTNVASLWPAPDGSLWIGFRPSGISVLRNGHVTRYGERDGLPRGTVQQFAPDTDGSLWAVAREGLLHFERGRWNKVEVGPAFGAPYGVQRDRLGTLWVATTKGMFTRAAGENHFQQIDTRNYQSPRGSVLVASSSGGVWASAERELLGFDRPGNLPRVITIPEIHAGPLLLDHLENVWASDNGAPRLLRISNGEAEKLPLDSDPNSGLALSLLEDREHNVWVGTYSALHRFSRSNVVREAPPKCSSYGMLSVAFVAGDAGSFWRSCDAGSAGRVEQIRDGVVLSSHVTPVFSVAYRDPTGKVWFGGPTSLGYVEKGRVVSTPLPLPTSGRPLQAMLREDSGAWWLSVTRIGLFRVADGQWTENGGLEGLPHTYPIVTVAGGGGDLWFGYVDSRVARVRGREVRMFGELQGLEVGNVLSILPQGQQLWVGGELGFALLQGDRFFPVHAESGALFAGTSGIVRARNGDLWLNGIDGIVHIAHAEVERLIGDPGHRVVVEIFNYLDGVPGAAIQLRPQPSAIETTDGRVWFSNTGGIVAIDATQLVRNRLPPPVTIWSVSSGANRYPNRGNALQLPQHTTSLQIEYSAGSLTVPERVQFRYRLDGLDEDWQQVGSRREALYTNLGPGPYRFHVSASNNDGVWNEAGASMDFVIAPAFYQTRWFAFLCGLACLGVLSILYRMRVRQVAAQVRGRLEARLGERERIARELHDTLLQGIQGLIWKFQAVSDRIPSGEPARQLMEESLDRADTLLGESRDRVKDLRSVPGEVTDLLRALEAEGEHFSTQRTKFRVSQQGTARALHPIVREELLLIVREALANAFTHSGAANIESEVTYSMTGVRVAIRDDGEGIGPAILEAGGRPGHFGLVGMRERASKLGAQLEIWSKPGAGTEVDLHVPAPVAYGSKKTGARTLRAWFAALRTRSKLEQLHE